jgi:predicted nucleotidyltransferase
MARTNMRDIEKATHGHAKKSLYVLRPLMAMRWLERKLGVVPTEFDVLVERIVEDEPLREAIANLIAAKRRGSEIDSYPLPPIVHEYMTSELARLAENEPVLDVSQYSIEVLNSLFRDALAEIWDTSN